MINDHAPMCTYCWPRLVVAVTAHRTTELPCCAPCSCTQHAPKVPRFIWRHLRATAQEVFGDDPREEAA